MYRWKSQFIPQEKNKKNKTVDEYHREGIKSFVLDEKNNWRKKMSQTFLTRNTDTEFELNQQ